MKSYKARGIVLGTVKYGDKAVIVNMLTDLLGRQSYIVQGLGSGKGRGSKLAYYQPLFALQFEGIVSDKSELHRLKDVQSSIVLQTIPYDIRKSTIALFISEVLYRLIGESEANMLRIVSLICARVYTRLFSPYTTSFSTDSMPSCSTTLLSAMFSI